VQAYPENPVLTRIWRGDHVESQHRGAWVLTDRDGSVIDGVGDFDAPVYTRSAIKSFQALPLIESGAADRFGFSARELALCVSSHNGEACHTDGVLELLRRMDLGPGALRCGPQNPADPSARRALSIADEKPTDVYNNCSGKHAGFLALTLHLGVPVERYLERESETQRCVARAVLAMAGVDESDVSFAIDGCSAPTFRFPLARLATAFARLSTPDDLAPERRSACERLLDAVGEHPEMIAGNHKRLCTALARVTGGRIFPKVGGEAVYGIGVRGLDRGFALKVDDGNYRGFNALIIDLLERFGFLHPDEVRALHAWQGQVLKNWAGLDVGRTEVVG